MISQKEIDYKNTIQKERETNENLRQEIAILESKIQILRIDLEIIRSTAENSIKL